MTQRQLKKNANILLNRYKKEMLEEICQLIKSGAIDFDKEDAKSFAKAKTLCKAVMESKAKDIFLFDKKAESDYRNLKNF
jgi:hypothetical protein